MISNSTILLLTLFSSLNEKSLFLPQQIPVQSRSTQVIDLKLGKVRGTVQHLHNGQEVNFFQGIRYGYATRFALPEPVQSWEGIYEATHSRSSCPQLNIFEHQSEDCLFLNVWQPHNKVHSPKSELKPVMVWIYGGGFNLGSIDFFLYNGAYIASLGDVIVVSMNYRLGPLGFLYSGTSSAPGNQGIHDQILALRWVQENIERFGGDSNQVTIFGESAGSLSVSALILSPLAKGLFHRAITQSGAISNIKQFSKEYAMEKSRQFAHKLGCNQEDLSQAVECLKEKPLGELILEAEGMNFLKMFSGQLLMIMYDDYAGLIPDKPGTLIKTGRVNAVDLLFGFVHDELAEITSMIDPELLHPLEHYSFSYIRDRLKHVAEKFSYPHIEKIINFYIKNLPKSCDVHQTRRLSIDFLSDPIMICPTYLFGGLLAQKFPEHHFYSYRFDHRASFLEILGCQPWMGVCHGADIPFTFAVPLHPGLIYFNNDDRTISKDMIQAWVTFAKTGHPERMGSTKWPEVKNKQNNYTEILTMSINKEYDVIDNFYKERCDQLWSDILF